MSIRVSADAPQIVLSGEIDILVADELRAAGVEVASRVASGSRVEIELGSVTFIDSTGLGALVAVRNRVKESNGTVVLMNASPAIARVIELAGLRDSFLA